MASAFRASLVVLGALYWTAAHGQVYRCTEGGKTTYGHVPCSVGSSRVVNTRPNSIDRSAEREHHGNVIQDAEAQRWRSQSSAGTGGRGPMAGRAVNSMECNNAKRDLAGAKSVMQTEISRGKQPGPASAAVKNAEFQVHMACGTAPLDRGRAAATAPSEAPAAPTPSAPPAPSVITHCAGGFCYDNMGGVYHSHGNGKTMTGPTGSTCIRTGSTMECH